jgi:hypothetical protein
LSDGLPPLRNKVRYGANSWTACFAIKDGIWIR